MKHPRAGASDGKDVGSQDELAAGDHQIGIEPSQEIPDLGRVGVRGDEARHAAGTHRVSRPQPGHLFGDPRGVRSCQADAVVEAEGGDVEAPKQADPPDLPAHPSHDLARPLANRYDADEPQRSRQPSGESLGVDPVGLVTHERDPRPLARAHGWASASSHRASNSAAALPA